MTDDDPPPPSFREVLQHGQALLAALEALEAAASRQAAEAQAELAQARARAEQLQGEIDDLRGAQLGWAAERQGLADERERLRGALESLQAQHRQTEEALSQAVDGRDQLRSVYEQLKQTQAGAADRLKAAFQEMSRLQDELQALTEAAKHRSDDVDALKARHEAERQAWQTEREELVKDAELAQARKVEAEQEGNALRQQLAKERAALEARASELEETLRRREGEFEGERERGRAELAEARQRISGLEQAEAAAHQEHEKLRRVHAELVDQANKLALEWNTRRPALMADVQRLTRELEQARAALGVSQERERERDTKLQQLEQLRQRERTAFDQELRNARESAAYPLTHQQSHDLNSRLNAVMGFAEILMDERTNQITPEERKEYLQLIQQSGRRLADAMRALMPEEDRGGEQPPAAVVPIAASSGRPEATILVADIDPVLRQRIEPFVSQAGYEVVFVGNAKEALAKAAALQPLVILVDLLLPPDGASGLVYELNRDPRTRDIPIVLTSRNDRDQLGVDIGQWDFLSKPVDRQQFLQMLVRYDLLADQDRARKMPGTLLLVDDDPENIRLVKAMLKSFNIAVLVAGGGREGIELARQHKPDLIILDLMMPEVDGFEVVSALRQDTTTSQIPILIYTAKNITSDDHRRLQGNIQSIIQKGEFSKERFLELVNKRGERRNRGAGGRPTGQAA